MSTVRLLSLLLTITLTGPSVASVLCDWTCAAKHQAAVPAESGCHKRDTHTSVPTVAAGHVCHELVAPVASNLTTAPRIEFLMVVAVVDVLPSDVPAAVATRVVVRPPGSSHAPSALLLSRRI